MNTQRDAAQLSPAELAPLLSDDANTLAAGFYTGLQLERILERIRHAAAMLSREPQASESVKSPWQEISTLKLSDDLIWLRRGDAIEGPRTARIDDPDQWDYWCPCEPPSKDDATAQALSHAYFLITGKSPQWSATWGINECLEEIDDAQKVLKKSLLARHSPTEPQAPGEAEELAAAKLTLSAIYQYANDTLSGPMPPVQRDMEWYRECVIEVRNRARDGWKYPNAAAPAQQRFCDDCNNYESACVCSEQPTMRDETVAAEAQAEHDLSSEMLEAALRDIDFYLQLIRDLLPEDLDGCDECGGDESVCRTLHPECPYPRARLVTAGMKPTEIAAQPSQGQAVRVTDEAVDRLRDMLKKSGLNWSRGLVRVCLEDTLYPDAEKAA